MKSKRIYYKPGPMAINGILAHGTTLKSITTYFELCQCFCSCPSPLSSMGTWEEVEVHGDECPNARPDRFVRLVNQEELDEYKILKI